jgi:hypothetical protein
MLIVNLAVSVLRAETTIALRVLYLMGDFTFAQLAFFWQTSNQPGLDWALLSQPLSALWIGAILAIVLSMSTQALLVYTRQTGDLLILLAVMVPLYLVVGLPFALVSERAIRSAKSVTKSAPRQSGASERKDRESRKLIYDLISALSATLNYQRVLETSLELSADTLEELDAPEVDRLFSAVLLYSCTDHRSPTLLLPLCSLRTAISSSRHQRIAGARHRRCQASPET